VPRECPPVFPGTPWLVTSDPSLRSSSQTHRDDDMQSLASLMSVKPSDVGNLDDFAESDEEEANGPGAPEVRTRGPQSGGFTVTYGLTCQDPRWM
jgi:hypothetical protein